MSIVQLAPRIVAGSALAGFGFAFGRDMYRETKRNWKLIALIVVATLAYVLLFMSSLWVARNYRSRLAGLLKKAGALVALIASYAATVYVNVLVEAFLALNGIAGNPETFRPISGWSPAGILMDLDERGTVFMAGFILQNLVMAAGLMMGAFQRRRRRTAWDTEASNEAFFLDNGLVSLDEENFRDDRGNRYRLLKVLKNELEFQAEGKRGKRAYIRFDDSGKYLSWSGLTGIS
ncbi:MAG: hypothetical protein OXN16_00720 [Gammaproteobacteria bacterium]|nr:hypothetical protein [Gammaproteobacteria bacterium]MDE0279593.1 hypothetical protein [Gammaproteobacteria bacterium]